MTLILGPVLQHSDDGQKLAPAMPKIQSPPDSDQIKLPDPPMDLLKVSQEAPKVQDKPLNPDVAHPSPVLELRMDSETNSSDHMQDVHDVKEM